MKFDLASLEAAATATFNVDVGKRDDGSPVGFVVKGPDSEEYEGAIRAVKMVGVKDSATRKEALDMATERGAEIVVDGVAKRDQLVLANCVVGWYGFTLGETEEAPFTKENFERVLRAKPSWRDRLLAEIENEANFVAG